ncbi:hypothetical protein HanXRQr2_Chr15g0673301 [Helianthus annuus]|uniref:Uncharacterized protein n=1 Tax=Helianthus annuus TaxID=4232 RepID=A0A9K3DWE8_HELAN|nr:hypothetical protein HanXRQr2_Chr15g0673301 [Helianthus annuus]
MNALCSKNSPRRQKRALLITMIEPINVLCGCLRVYNIVLLTTEGVLDEIRVCIKDKWSPVCHSVLNMLSSCYHGDDLEDRQAVPIIIDRIECVKQVLKDSFHDNFILATFEQDAYEDITNTRATPFISMDDSVIRVLPIPDDQRAFFEEFKRNMIL